MIVAWPHALMSCESEWLAMFFTESSRRMKKQRERGPSEKPEGRGDAKGRAEKNGITFIIALAAFRRAAEAAPKSAEGAGKARAACHQQRHLVPSTWHQSATRWIEAPAHKRRDSSTLR